MLLNYECLMVQEPDVLNKILKLINGYIQENNG